MVFRRPLLPAVTERSPTKDLPVIVGRLEAEAEAEADVDVEADADAEADVEAEAGTEPSFTGGSSALLRLASCVAGVLCPRLVALIVFFSKIITSKGCASHSPPG